MALHYIIFLALLIISITYPLYAATTNQSQFFDLIKISLSGKTLSDRNITGEKPFCNFTRVSCNNQGYVLDMIGWSISGRFPDGICSYLPKLRALRLGHSQLHGGFHRSIINCSLLEELNMSTSYLSGTLPDFSPLKSLRILDMSYNNFRGDFPMSVTNLTNLELLNFKENVESNLWQLRENISRLTKLKSMILMTCKLDGQIPASIGNMISLIDLELSGNYLTGPIPAETGLLKNLQQLELYYNYHLSGNIPEELGNLTELVDLDISNNKLTGNIPESICHLPKLEVLQLYNNSLAGEIPSAIANSTSSRILSINNNVLTGEVPKKLGQLAEVCKEGEPVYFLVLDNMFSGELPDSYAKCKTLLRFRVSHNRLEGPIEGLLSLPQVSIIDF